MMNKIVRNRANLINSDILSNPKLTRIIKAGPVVPDQSGRARIYHSSDYDTNAGRTDRHPPDTIPLDWPPDDFPIPDTVHLLPVGLSAVFLIVFCS